MKVLIADDEQIVLQGLQYIIDWPALGFDICGTASDGAEALEKIMTLTPDLVMMDIRMPKMTGIEVVQAAVEGGYTGKFIILSGVSDFKLAQTAMRYGVDYYLTKPIDEDELEEAVKSIHALIESQSKNESSYRQYRSKAKQSILQELLTGICDYSQLDIEDLHLKASVYRVVSYENYNQDYFAPTWDFAEMLRVTNQDNNTFDLIELDQHKIILLKGDFAINRFNDLLAHYNTAPQKGSPFDSVFLAYGRTVTNLEDIHHSYQDVCDLIARRFFCQENQHIVGIEALPSRDSLLAVAPLPQASYYADKFIGYIQSHNLLLITDCLKELRDALTKSSESMPSLKHFLIDIYILVKQKIMQLYPKVDIPFLANASAIELIEQKYYLYEIITFLAEQFDMWAHSVGTFSGENVLDEVVYYIQHNYSQNLKLENIAPLFGYNSSYLGKVFTKKMGQSFNSYVDMVRIEEAKKLLTQKELKVYAISEQIGYSNVDYFHKKFKKLTGTSPAEYRKMHI